MDGWDGRSEVPTNYVNILGFAQLPEISSLDETDQIGESWTTLISECDDEDESLDVFDVAEDESSEEEDPTTGVGPAMTRKEQKQCDKEIPWRQILLMPKEDVQTFVDAVHTEADSWKKFGAC